MNSPSREVKILSRQNDPRSTTCKNLKYLRELTSLADPENYSSDRVKMELPKRDVPDSDRWRLSLLNSLFKLKEERHLDVVDTKQVCAMIQSLCNT